MAGPVELDEAGLSLWRAVEEDWADQPRHDRFVQHAYSGEMLPAAVARYRATVRPDDPTAAKMIARITFLATQQALRPTVTPRRSLTRSPFFLGVVVAGALLGAILGLLWKGR